MKRPRIILADRDENYMAALQSAFAESFFGRIELEAITDTAYFQELFAGPQRADIAVMAEEFYSPSLKRHNITALFLLTEQREEEETGGSKTGRIFKYSSPQEIVRKTLGRYPEVFHRTGEKEGETRIVLVCSACGGVGKTTAALGLCACLAANRRKALYINAAGLQVFGWLLEDKTPVDFPQTCLRTESEAADIYREIRPLIRKEQFYYLPPFRGALLAAGTDFGIYERLAVSAAEAGEFDYIIIDADTGLDEGKARLMDLASKVVVVTAQTEAAVYATNILLNNIAGPDRDRYLFVCNNFTEGETADALRERAAFLVDDYIGHMEEYGQTGCADWAKDRGMQRIAFLVL